MPKLEPKTVVRIGPRGGRIVKERGLHREYWSDPKFVARPPTPVKVDEKGREHHEPHDIQGLLKLPGSYELAYVTKLAGGDPDGLLAVTRDSQGRLKPWFTKEHYEQSHAEIFDRCVSLLHNIDHIRAGIRQAMQAPSKSSQQAAEVLFILDSTGLRLGSDKDTKAKQKAYGISTLRGQHVKIDNGKVTLEFPAKNGKRAVVPVKDSEVASILMQRAREAGEVGRLFPETSDAAVRGLMKRLSPPGTGKGSQGFLVKDLRTLKATVTAKAAINDVQESLSSETQYKRARNAVCAKVAAVLGNTPREALNSYIVPAVWGALRKKMVEAKHEA